MFIIPLTGEGPSFGGPRSAAGPADDDVAVVDGIESDDEVDGGYDDAGEFEDADFDELEGEFIVSDDGDDEIDDGDSEDEGVRPRRVVSVDFDERRDEGAGRGDEGDDVGPSERTHSIQFLLTDLWRLVCFSSLFLTFFLFYCRV